MKPRLIDFSLGKKNVRDEEKKFAYIKLIGSNIFLIPCILDENKKKPLLRKKNQRKIYIQTKYT